MSAWDNPQEMLARAETANAQGDRDMAYQMYARASELNPQDPTAWRGRAQTAANQDEALVSYAYASALYPEDASLTQALDTSLTQRLADSNPGDVPLLIEVGQEFAEVGLIAHAQQVFTRAADLDENASDAVIWLAGLETDKEKQTAYLNRALAINPRDPRARAGLLTINPPAPPPPAPAESTTAPGESRMSKMAQSGVPTADNASMERLRKLRESALASSPPPNAQPTPAAKANTHERGGDNNLMRIVLLLLLAAFVVLLFAGIFLMVNP